MLAARIPPQPVRRSESNQLALRNNPPIVPWHPSAAHVMKLNRERWAAGGLTRKVENPRPDRAEGVQFDVPTEGVQSISDTPEGTKAKMA